MRTLTVKKNSGGQYKPGWHEIVVSKANYGEFQGNKFTNKDIKLAVKNDITGSDLTPKQIEQFKTDPIDRGRASKTKNRLTMTDDFTIQQARKAESYLNETTDEFKTCVKFNSCSCGAL